MTLDDFRALEAVEARLRALLPEAYQDTYDDVQPVSMGSAGLRYGADGQVAWDKMWQSFCDLAMAGGPPHKGMLLEPASTFEIDAQADAYDRVVAEICRGIVSVTGLGTDPSPVPGWVRVECFGDGMAGWLLRAVVMENVAARAEGVMLDLPAGPHFRLEKEIKNVITVIAKTWHYWDSHMGRTQQRMVSDLIARMDAELPLLRPHVGNEQAAGTADPSGHVTARIRSGTDLIISERRYPGWLGVECPNVRAAVWQMRMLVASNVLSRREGTTLFVPIDAERDRRGDRIVDCLTRVHRFARVRGIA